MSDVPLEVGPFDPHVNDRPDAIGPEDVDDNGEVISK